MPRPKGSKNKPKPKKVDKAQAIVHGMKTVLDELTEYLQSDEIGALGVDLFLIAVSPVKYGESDSWMVYPEHKANLMLKAIEPVIRTAGFIHKTEIPQLTSQN